MKILPKLPAAGPLLRILTIVSLFAAGPGAVYAAVQPDTGNKVNVKVIKPPVPAAKDSIISIKTLGTHSDSAKIKDVIAIKVLNNTPLDSLYILYVDGMPVKSLKPYSINVAEKVLYFRLNDSIQNMLLNFSGSSPFEKTTLPVNFGLGSLHQQFIKNASLQTYVEVRQKISHIWIWVAAVVLLGLSLLGLKYNILKDDGNLYYSLGRTQLFYWTVLVLVAYLSICFKTDTVPDLPMSVLAILGISVGTTAFSKIVENHHKEAPIDVDAKSEGFMMDILSDGSSINIQRFQNVAFNIFFGVIFLQKAFANNIMPDFDQNVLILMGISSGAYAGLKNYEASKEQNKPPVPTNDDPKPGSTAPQTSPPADPATNTAAKPPAEQLQTAPAVQPPNTGNKPETDL